MLKKIIASLLLCVACMSFKNVEATSFSTSVFGGNGEVSYTCGATVSNDKSSYLSSDTIIFYADGTMNYDAGYQGQSGSCNLGYVFDTWNIPVSGGAPAFLPMNSNGTFVNSNDSLVLSFSGLSLGSNYKGMRLVVWDHANPGYGADYGSQYFTVVSPPSVDLYFSSNTTKAYLLIKRS